jgi:ferric-dicitrate binding protein FerR (iron transport regulator)
MSIKNYMTGRGESISMYLPDSSKVILNSESRLQYNLYNWDRKRIVVLIGEAYFEVRKGSPFVVETNMGKVHVLGTSFNVLSRKNSFEVYCFTGKVQVQSSDKKASTLLSRGLFTRFLPGNKFSVPQIIDFDKTFSFGNGKVYFKNASYEEVLTAFEKKYNVIIEQSNISDRYYTGYFPCDNMEKALNLICVPMNLRYEIVNDTLVEIKNK